MDDLEKVRQYFELDAPALLGHSWGAVLALEYALRHPTRVSHLILMNPAPVSASDVAVLRKAYLEKLGTDMDRQREILTGAAYQAGDPEAVTARYRIHFKPALKRPEDYERLMAAMRAAFIRQGKEGIVKARAVEDQLMRDTRQLPDYDLLPKLRSLRIPTLIIAGDHDFIPLEIAERIAQAIPDASLVTLRDCGRSRISNALTTFATRSTNSFRARGRRRALDQLGRRPTERGGHRFPGGTEAVVGTATRRTDGAQDPGSRRQARPRRPRPRRQGRGGRPA